MKISRKYLIDLLKQTFKEFGEDKVFGKAAAVSYYAVFALPGLMLVAVSIAALVFDQQMVIDEFSAEFSNVLGESSAKTFRRLMTNVQNMEGSWIATTVGILTLIFSSTAIFIQVQLSLNEIWGVTKKPGSGVKRLVRDRIISLAFVLVLNLLFLLSLVVSALISFLNSWIVENLSDSVIYVSYIINITLTIALVTLLFAAIFKYLPDVSISWKVVWPGAILTAALFTLGKELIAFYLTHSDVGSSYGAGSAIILFLLWIYYSSMIVFLGAEFTQVYARKEGERLVPADHAQFTPAYKAAQRDRQST